MHLPTMHTELSVLLQRCSQQHYLDGETESATSSYRLFNILNLGVCYDQFCETFIKNYYETGVSQQIDVYLLSRASLTET